MSAWIKLLVLALGLGVATSADAAQARIIKVLPHLIDHQGRHTLSPSLYERDAYQAELRRQPELASALRFDVQWKGVGLKRDGLKLRLELRVSGEPSTIILEESVKPKGLFSHWNSLKLEGEAFKLAGKVTAWRATLWQGEEMVAEQKSFLW